MFRNTWNAQRTQPPPLTPAAPAPMPMLPAELAHAPLHMPTLVSQFQQQQQLLHKQPPPQQQMGPAPPAQAHRSGLPTGMLTPVNGQPNSPTLQQQRQHQQQQFQQLQGQQAFGSQQHFQQQQQQPPSPVGFLPHHPALTAAALASMPGSLPDGQQLFVANRRHSNDSSGEICTPLPLTCKTCKSCVRAAGHGFVTPAYHCEQPQAYVPYLMQYTRAAI